ncbi:MAG: cytochrome c1, partial [Proteobacteria bacterium]|nr:cytochrome c1 [Pseudomonadota bacterium]
MRRLSIIASALAFAVVSSVSTVSGPALAADAVHPPAEKWGFSGPLGTYDRKAVKRGLQVYQEVCAACHSLNLVAFRHLSGIGFSEAEIKALAAKSKVLAGPSEDGEIIEDGELRRRDGRPEDFFPAPYLNKQAAAAAIGGAIPPDLS